MSHQRTRSPSKITARDTDEYNKLSKNDLKAKYNEVYSKFATYVAMYPRSERLPEHHDKRGLTKKISDWVFSADRVQLVNEIIDMEARMRELDAGAAQVAKAERIRHDEAGEGYLTEKELVTKRMKEIIDSENERQRAQNELLGFGPYTNLEVVANQQGAATSSIGFHSYKDKGGRTKRAKKAKRSHRYRHLKQRSRTRKH